MWWHKDTTTAAPTVAQGIYTVSDKTTAAPWTVQDITWTTPNAYPNTAPTWTTGSGSSGAGRIHNPPPPNKIKLQGEDADIEINGRSLSRALQALEQRLLLLRHEARAIGWCSRRIDSRRDGRLRFLHLRHRRDAGPGDDQRPQRSNDTVGHRASSS